MLKSWSREPRLPEKQRHLGKVKTDADTVEAELDCKKFVTLLVVQQEQSDHIGSIAVLRPQPCMFWSAEVSESVNHQMPASYIYRPTSGTTAPISGLVISTPRQFEKSVSAIEAYSRPHGRLR